MPTLSIVEENPNLGLEHVEFDLSVLLDFKVLPVESTLNCHSFGDQSALSGKTGSIQNQVAANIGSDQTHVTF